MKTFGEGGGYERKRSRIVLHSQKVEKVAYKAVFESLGKWIKNIPLKDKTFSRGSNEYFGGMRESHENLKKKQC